MTTAAAPDKKRASLVAKIKKWTPIYLMMLPGALYLLINNYIPMFGLVIAFKQIDFQKGIFESPWIGFQNFQFLFQTKDAFVITRNTLLYNIAFIILNTVIGIVFAIFICDITWKAGKKVYQSAILFPYLMSWVIVGYIIYAIFSMQYGIANKSILPAFGMDPLMWYNDPKYWPAILIITNTWKGIGYGCLIYISSINGIEASYFEAAELDGANKFQQIWNITLPEILPSVITLTLLSIGRIFYSDFGLFYQVPRDSGLLYSTTNTIDTYVYRGLMKLGNVGMASAAGFYQSVVGFILVLLSNWVVRKISPDNALF
mgnify:FL=1